jgi:hypothetical protein
VCEHVCVSECVYVCVRERDSVCVCVLQLDSTVRQLNI